MFLVALTRWQNPSPETLSAEVTALGPLLGRGAYELRLELSRPPPVVLLETTDVGLARSLLASVRGRGHGAVACDAASVTSSESMLRPKTFVLGSEAVTLSRPGTPDRQARYAELLALIVATHARQDETSEEVREKKLSLGRAALTGGLVRSKTSSVTRSATTVETERVLYALDRSGSGHALFCETRLHYSGLGAAMKKSSSESFTALVAELRARAPSARFDDRLLKSRTGSSLNLSRTSASRTLSTSNAADVDLAVHHLAVAFLQGQG